MQDRAWMLPAAFFLAVQFLFCAAIALSFGFYEPPPFQKYAKISVGLVLLVAGIGALWSLRVRPNKPTRHLLELDWSKHRGFAVAMVFVWLQFVALTWGKAMLPVAADMWADVPLADLDAAVFGTDPWRLLPAPHRVIDAIYMAWLPTVGFVFALLYFSDRPNRSTAILALFLTIGSLGTIGQYAFPSGGPIFFERLGLGERFADMPAMFATHRAADRLWLAFEGQYISFATGISAFPSIHVAVCAWIVLAFRNIAAVAYAVLIFVGSVVLGWHYAIDGIAATFGTVLCYGLARWILATPRPVPSFARLFSSARRASR